MVINVEKQVMRFSKWPSSTQIITDQKQVEDVESFSYLASMVAVDVNQLTP